MNIDFSQLITAQDKADALAAQRIVQVKTECKRRILERIPFEAQQNIAQAVTVYTAAILRGADPAGAGISAGLTDADFDLVSAGRDWIAAMQAASRDMATDPEADPGADAAWPALSEDVAALVARF